MTETVVLMYISLIYIPQCYSIITLCQTYTYVKHIHNAMPQGIENQLGLLALGMFHICGLYM